MVTPYGNWRKLIYPPFMIGVGNNVAVRPATEYIFNLRNASRSILKGGLTPINFIVSEYDRAAHVVQAAKALWEPRGKFISKKRKKRHSSRLYFYQTVDTYKN